MLVSGNSFGKQKLFLTCPPSTVVGQDLIHKDFPPLPSRRDLVGKKICLSREFWWQNNEKKISVTLHVAQSTYNNQGLLNNILKVCMT